jgi:hypothetical protein
MTAAFAMAGLGVGVLAGTHAAIWGSYKDSPYEGFTWRQFLRSIVLAAVLGPIVAWLTGLDPLTAAGLATLFGVVYAIERVVGEAYKTFFREQDQSKYTIPMQLAVLGRPVASRAARAVVGLGYVAAVAAGVIAVGWLEGRMAPLPRLTMALSIGALGGWFSAFGGAWKDAPIEGFELLKFFRSPVVAAGFAWLALGLVGSWTVVMLAAIGYTVATIESYKTFLSAGKPPGKFASQPLVFPEARRWRHRLIPVYLAIWMVVIWAAGAGLASRAAAPATAPGASVPVAEAVASRDRPAGGARYRSGLSRVHPAEPTRW